MGHHMSSTSERTHAVRQNRMVKFAHRGFALFACLVVMALIFLAPVVQFKLKRPIVVLSAHLFLVAALVLLGISSICQSLGASGAKEQKGNTASFYIRIGTASILLLILQAAIVHGAWFEAGWDPWRLLGGGTDEQLYWYFSEYPNQRFLAGLFASISDAARVFGLDNEYLCAVAGGCICINIGCFLSSCVARRIGGDITGYACYFTLVLLAGLSPWMLVPYSDSYGFFLISVIAFSAICLDVNVLSVFLFVFASYIGYLIKPTVIFLPASFIITKAYAAAASFLANREDKDYIGELRGKVPALIKLSASVVLSLALGCFVRGWISLPNEDYDPEGSFSAAHYLMMGFNPDTQGIFNGEDVGFSHSFDTRQERTRANITTWLERVRDAGPDGVAKLFLRKLLCTYGDGSFAWEQEGHFYVNTYGQSGIVKSIYGIDDAIGEDVSTPRDAPFMFFSQLIWYSVLLGLLANLFAHNPSNDECAMSISLLLLTAFHLLFECKARYLFLYLPIFCVLAAVGLRYLSRLVSRRKESTTPEGRH